MVKSQQARGIARREAILEAALSLFATKGSRGTSIAAVADQAGVTDAGVLYHFPTKEALLLHVLAFHEQRQAADIEATLDAHGYEVLLGARELGAQMEATPELTALGLTLSAEHLHDDTVVNEYFRARYNTLQEYFEHAVRDAIKAGEVDKGTDATAEASALVAHLDGIRFQWFFSDGRVSMADSVRTYVDAMISRISTATSRATAGH